MIINENTRIVGKTVVLVPYKKSHVIKYHKWMKSEELRERTASEELTLDEEYQMQESWHKDVDKCTFIILDKEVWLGMNNDIDAMIGDTNLFFLEKQVAEVEIMIAEPSFQGRGRGKEAVLLMMKYGCNSLFVSKFIAKIGLNNTISIKLFSKLGFAEVSKSQVFQEITMERLVTEEWKDWLFKSTEHALVESYK